MSILIWLQIASVFFASMLDRLRGDAKHLLGQRMLDKVALGYIMAIVAGYPFDPIITPSIVVAMVLGMSFGWGEPIGATLDGRAMNPAKLEWWQKGILARNKTAALAFRGAMWGIPIGIVGAVFKDPVLMSFVPVYTVVFIAAVYLVKGKKMAWEKMEYIRGALAAALVLAVYLGVNYL